MSRSEGEYDMADRYISIVICAILLTFSFYFIDPREFLEKLGYATLATLSFIELIDIVGARRKREKEG